jgi:hypothetical protein
MFNSSVFKKSLIALSVVTLAATVGVSSASALSKPLPLPFHLPFNLQDKGHDRDHDKDHGYNKDQCEDNGWKTFKNPNGSQKFKNQGQCIAFFDHEGDDHDHNDNHDGHGHDNGSGKH